MPKRFTRKELLTTLQALRAILQEARCYMSRFLRGRRLTLRIDCQDPFLFLENCLTYAGRQGLWSKPLFPRPIQTFDPHCLKSRSARLPLTFYRAHLM